jgi:hypothetical protein
MNHTKTIAMLVLTVLAVMATTALVLPSMTMDAQAEQCGSSASSVEGSISTDAAASEANDDCQTHSSAEPLEPPTTTTGSAEQP